MSLFDFPGRCRVCGCTNDDPCFNPKHGYCGWADEAMTICTHCADKEIADDPETVHCVNSNGKPYREWKVTVKEVGRDAIVTEYHGHYDLDDVKEHFGLKEPDVEWFSIEEKKGVTNEQIQIQKRS